MLISNKKVIQKLFKTILVLGIFIAIYILWCFTQYQPERKTVSLFNGKDNPQNWSSVLTQSSDISEFKVLNTGSVLVPLGGVLNEDKVVNKDKTAKSIWVDVFAFVFHHKKRGWILIDSGLDASFQNKGNIEGVFVEQAIEDFRQQPKQNIGSQLAALNIVVDEVYFSHLHSDHSSGISELPAGVKMFIGKGEPILNLPLLFSHQHFSTVQVLNELDLQKGQAITPFDKVLDVFGDQSFWAIATPGHSDGNMSFLVITNNTNYLLTGDASHTRYGFENNIEPGWSDSSNIALNSLKQLKQFSSLYPNVEVIFGHER